MALPIVLGIGYQVWQARIAVVVARRFGRGLIRVLWRALILRESASVESLIPTRADGGQLLLAMLRGASAFVHAGVLVGLVAGVLIAVVSGPRFWVAFAATNGIATVYGLILTRLARAGYLPPPDGGS